tara:strand:- start:2403 stop:3092 length:690 start_codon:yes stop_codon:yes gene_type:complete
MTQELHYNQIPMDFGFFTKKTFDNFIIGDNKDLFNCIHNLTNSDQVILIYGSKSSGKSHICEATYNQYIRSAFFIDDKSILLNNISNDFYELLIIDNLDKLISSKKDEELLFTLVNNQILHKKPLVVSLSKDIEDCNITLKDLSSRLLSDKIFTIRDLNDLEKIDMMTSYCSQRGLEISEKVLHYIINNCTRDLYFLCALMKSLDNVSLSMKKKITIPFIKKVIEIYHS